MVKTTKENQIERSTKETIKGDRKIVTYTYPDGPSCTVVSPAPDKPTETAPSTSFNLAMPTLNTNNMKKNNATPTSTTNSQIASTAVSSSTDPKDYSDLRTGVKKKEAIDIVHGFKFPDRPFTIKEVLLGTGINHWYVSSYIKSHAKVVGDAPKAPGVRGKIAKLYQIETKS